VRLRRSSFTQARCGLVSADSMSQPRRARRNKCRGRGGGVSTSNSPDSTSPRRKRRSVRVFRFVRQVRSGQRPRSSRPFPHTGQRTCDMMREGEAQMPQALRRIPPRRQIAYPGRSKPPESRAVQRQQILTAPESCPRRPRRRRDSPTHLNEWLVLRRQTAILPLDVALTNDCLLGLPDLDERFVDLDGAGRVSRQTARADGR